MASDSGAIALVGSPTALGGHFAGMERTPAELRRRGLLARLRERPGLQAVDLRDCGDAANQPGWRPDPDPRSKNRASIAAYLPRLAEHVAAALRGDAADARLLLVGGDCTSHAGALAGIRRARPAMRLGLAWFDAHGDFNTPESTPSGNVWGMPFALACGRGDPDLVAACDAPTVREADAALLGGQVLDESESRKLAASPIAHFGAGMLATDGGRAALAGWTRVVAEGIDGWYIAFDLDALDRSGGWAVATPEPDGLALDDALSAVRIVARSGPVIGFGATAVMFDDAAASGRDADGDRTVDAVAALAETALA